METNESLHGDVKGKRALPPSGLHRAWCFGVVTVGTVEDSYKGNPKMTKKIRLYFELVDAKHVWNEEQGPRSFVHEEEFTQSMAGKANLRALIDGYHGKAMTDEEAKNFNILDLIGCDMTLIKRTSASGNDRMEIQSMTKFKDTDPELPAPENSKLLFTFAGPFKQEAFDRLPTFLQDRIKSSLEYKENYGHLSQPTAQPTVAAVVVEGSPRGRKAPF
jgi:hypothetical protein